MARIVNTSDKPYEFCFNAQVFGPYEPGRIVDLPDEVAAHGVARSQVLDEIGNTVAFRCAYYNDVKGDKVMMDRILTYDCPLAASDQCNAGSFKSLDELRAHLESHWAVPKPEPAEDDLFASTKPAESSRSKR